MTDPRLLGGAAKTIEDLLAEIEQLRTLLLRVLIHKGDHLPTDLLSDIRKALEDDGG